MDAGSALAWSFATGGEMSERYEWLTDMMSPPYGMDATQQLRRDPHVVLAFDGLESAGNRRRMEHAVAMWGARRWHVPLVCDSAATTAAAWGADTEVGVDTAHRRFVAGGNAMLLAPDAPERAEVVEIASVAADALTLDEPLAGDWPAGSLIVPTIACWLDETPQISRFTADAGPYSIAFRAAEPMAFTADFGDAGYRDLPVFEAPVYWTQDPAYTPARRAETVGDEIGPLLLHDQGRMPVPRISLEVTLQGAAEIDAHRSLLAALAGRYHPIWVPSYGADFRLLSIASSTAIDVEECGFAGWPLQGNRRDIRIERRGAAPLYRRITAAAVQGAGVERLTLDAALPGDLVAGDVGLVSFLALCRQDADVNSLRLWSRGVVQSLLTFAGAAHAL